MTKRYSSDEEGDLAIPLADDPLRSSHDEGYDYNGGDSFDEEEAAGLIDGSSRNAHATPSSSYPRPRSGWHDVFQKLRWRAATASRSSSKSGRSASRGLQRLGFVMLAFMLCLGVLQLVTIARGAYIALFPAHRNRVVTEWEQIGKGGDRARLGHYPTDFSRDVLPIACHSHNDYWRAVPLYSGISAGCIGTEADVWLLDGDDHANGTDAGSRLLVGHDESSLTRNRTLRSLYLDPLIEILDRQNPTTEFADGSKTSHGVFDTERGQVLTLLIDLKTEGARTFDAVVEALDPLRQKGYLTHVDGAGKVVERPIRVVGTGNTPFASVLSGEHNPYRDIFFDAPIEEMAAAGTSEKRAGVQGRGVVHGLREDSGAKQTKADYSPTNSYYASGSFTDSIGFMWGWSLTAAQLAKLRAQVKGAHDRGLKVRYWETPAWPVSRRNSLWKILVEEGADLLNVDDLKGAVEEDWRRAGRWWG